MTILTVLADALPIIGVDIAAPNISSTDFEMRQILAIANRAGVDIANRAEWQNMNVDVSVAGSISEIALPADFQEMAEFGAVRLNKTAFTPIRAIIEPELFQFAAAKQPSQIYYRLSDGKIKFSSILDSDGAVYTYQSKNWLADDKSVITENADVTKFPEHLLTQAIVWRWLRQKGLPYSDELAEYEASLLAAIAANRGVG